LRGWCGRLIKVGVTAIKAAGRYYGDFYTNHQHPECHAAGLAYAKETDLWGDEFTWFQHTEMHRELEVWLLDNHPIVAARMNLEHEVAA
jgi:hypothetical protein